MVCRRCSLGNRGPCPTDPDGITTSGNARPEIPLIHETIRPSPTTCERVGNPAICPVSGSTAASEFSPRYGLRRNPIGRILKRSKSLESVRRPCPERACNRRPAKCFASQGDAEAISRVASHWVVTTRLVANRRHQNLYGSWPLTSAGPRQLPVRSR